MTFRNFYQAEEEKSKIRISKPNLNSPTKPNKLNT